MGCDAKQLVPFSMCTRASKRKIIKITHADGLCAWGMCGVGDRSSCNSPHETVVYSRAFHVRC